MLGKTEGRKRRWQRMRWLDGITDSMVMNLGNLSNSERWWGTGRPGALQSMGSQRVRHDWVTEQLNNRKPRLKLPLEVSPQKRRLLRWNGASQDYRWALGWGRQGYRNKREQSRKQYREYQSAPYIVKVIIVSLTTGTKFSCWYIRAGITSSCKIHFLLKCSQTQRQLPSVIVRDKYKLGNISIYSMWVSVAKHLLLPSMYLWYAWSSIVWLYSFLSW